MIYIRVITLVNYNQVDLNLLRVFDAVMTELNVTRAAFRLHMTQPAVSNALKRLRHLLNDELFIKVPTGVRATPKATQVWQPLRDALIQIQQTLKPLEFEPTTATTTFRIAMNDFTANLVLPELVRVIEETAPGINIRTMPTTYINAPMLLEQAEIDLAIGVFANPGIRLRSHFLLTSPFVCVMRQGHPLANQQLTLERYIQAKHLLVTLTGESTGLIDPLLQERGLKRQIALTVNQFAVAPRIIAQSNLIAVLPLRIVLLSGMVDYLHRAALPIELAPTTLQMMWHERNHLETGQQWLRTRLIEICALFE
jgi:DNA-binding transcriptional LysR family regulator